MSLSKEDAHLLDGMAYGDHQKRLLGDEDEEGEDLGPCASRPTPKYWPSLEIRKKSGECFAFSYSPMLPLHFDKTRTVITIDIPSPDPWQIVISGVRLKTLFAYLHQHRIEWIEEGTRDIGYEDKAFIESIAVKPISSPQFLLHRTLNATSDPQKRFD